MKTLNKYWFLFLTVLILGAGSAFSQEKEKLKSLLELKQLEKGFVEVDELDPLYWQSIPDVPDLQFISYRGVTKIHLRKKLHDLSLSHKYFFNVEEKYSNIDFFIRGEIREGVFQIKLIKPDKTVFRDIKIVPGRNYNWNQTFGLDKVKKGGIGKWTVELSCSQATGFYQFVSSSR